MNDILKQRLVGALILVALGVVFWPIIFVEPGTRVEPGQVMIPPPPQVDTSPVAQPQPEQWRASPESYEVVEPEADAAEATVELADPVLAVDEDGAGQVAAAAPPTAAAPTVRSSAPEAPALDENGVPLAWSLQIASVSTLAKAEALREQLLAMQEKAYIRRVERGDKDLYRVYVGPKFERAQLEQIQSAVDARFGVKSLIVRYLP